MRVQPTKPLVVLPQPELAVIEVLVCCARFGCVARSSCVPGLGCVAGLGSVAGFGGILGGILLLARVGTGTSQTAATDDTVWTAESKPVSL